MIDPSLYAQGFLDDLRVQADQSREYGEGTISPENFWRRTQDDWVLGAGQEFIDKRDSDTRQRFRSSEGISPWRQGIVEMLRTTEAELTHATASGFKLIVAGTYVYAISPGLGTAYYTQDPNGTWTSLAVAGITDACSDGARVYFATTGGVKRIDIGGTVVTSFNALVATRIDYVMSRLMAANGNLLYNIVDGTTPSALNAGMFNTSWLWTSNFTEGLQHIYIGGGIGEQSAIYRISIREDGTALTAPTLAAQLPDNEPVQVLASYIGVMVVGTSKGLRLATQDGSGALSYGPFVATGSCRCLEPQDRFVWFGIDAATGNLTPRLGRIDLSRFSESLVPAYAYDLEPLSRAKIDARVRSVVSFNGRRIFSLENLAPTYANNTEVWVESETVLRDTSTINSGKVSFDLPERKQFRAVDLRFFEPLPAGSRVSVRIFVDDIPSSSASATAGARGLRLEPDLVGEVVEVEVTLTRGSSNESPLLGRWTISAIPVTPTHVQGYVIPIVLREDVLSFAGERIAYDVPVELAALDTLRINGLLVDFQLFSETFKVIVDDVRFPARESEAVFTQALDGIQGVAAVTLKAYRQVAVAETLVTDVVEGLWGYGQFGQYAFGQVAVT